MRLAAWFHDAIYDREPKPEERSAEWAHHALVGWVDDDVVDEVARLVRLTEHHRLPRGADDRNGAALCDADLGILATPHTRYAEYLEAVRAEYEFVSDEAFAHGRSAIVSDLVSRDRLFVTDHAHDNWDVAARGNLWVELAMLSPRRAAGRAGPTA